MKSLLYSVLGVALWLFASCSQEVKISLRTDEPSPLVKEYANVVVPPNIAPLNFFVDAAGGKAREFEFEGSDWTVLSQHIMSMG